MTEGSPRQSIELQLLGDVRLLVDGDVVSGRAVQKRRLALLAYLLRAPERTVHRDRLTGVLWSDSAPDAARRLLNEAVNVIRRELGADLIRSVSDQLQLAPTVTSDADRFERAFAAGEMVEAVELYAGAMFGAWSVGDVPEFEQWAESERAELARRYAEAVPRAAAALIARGEYTAAASVFARLAVQDPDSVLAAEGEARALAMAGEPMQAVRRLDQFAERWRSEFSGDVPV